MDTYRKLWYHKANTSILYGIRLSKFIWKCYNNEKCVMNAVKTAGRKANLSWRVEEIQSEYGGRLRYKI